MLNRSVNVILLIMGVDIKNEKVMFNGMFVESKLMNKGIVE